MPPRARRWSRHDGGTKLFAYENIDFANPHSTTLLKEINYRSIIIGGSTKNVPLTSRLGPYFSNAVIALTLRNRHHLETNRDVVCYIESFCHFHNSPFPAIRILFASSFNLCHICSSLTSALLGKSVPPKLPS